MIKSAKTNVSRRTETILYGRKSSDEEWCETILSTNPKSFLKVRELAGIDGWGNFREATIDLGTGLPNFSSPKLINL